MINAIKRATAHCLRSTLLAITMPLVVIGAAAGLAYWSIRVGITAGDQLLEFMIHDKNDKENG